MNEREEQIEWIAGALSGIGVEDRDQAAATLYSQGVRVLGRDEAIVSWADKTLLDLVQQAAVQWESAKAAARAEPKSESWVGPPKEALILAALAGAGKPLTTLEAIRAAADWHPDYKPRQVEWDPWRDAWRRLLVQRRIQKAGLDPVGEFVRWKPVPVPASGWHPALVEFWERQREFPGLCVAFGDFGGRETMYGRICGKPEAESGSGACKEHPQ